MSVRMRIAAAAVALIGLLAAAPQAETAKVPGADDPALEAALQTWLDGDDLPALQALGDLARGGNRAAQVLLGRIASDGALHEQVTASLPRAERVALLRQPVGLSGRSWLSAATDVPLAVAFLQTADAAGRPAAVLALTLYGEWAAAIGPLYGMLGYGQWSEADAIFRGAGDVPDEATWLAISARAVASGMSHVTTNGPFNVDIGTLPPAARLPWMGVRVDKILPGAQGRDAVLKEVVEVPSWRPLVSLCQAHCPGSVPTCAAAAASLLPSGVPMPFASPVETLIPTDRYWASARIERDVIRRLSPAWRDVGALGLRGRNTTGLIDACFLATADSLYDVPQQP